MHPEFAALVVHDLKNALGVLEAQLAALREAPDRDTAAEAHRHCADMRRRFLAFLTLHRGDDALRAHCEDESPEAFLAGLASGVAGPAGALLPRVDACTAAPPYWFFDYGLVRMAMEAALHNAWRFARTEIVLSARVEAGYLVLSVTDDGPGPRAAQAATRETTASACTTGLGTELCRAVARAHGTADRPRIVRLFDAAGGGAGFELWLA